MKSGSRIVGGQDAMPGAWPWQVSLQYMSLYRGFRHTCGGTIINNNWVMSAAHCFLQRRDIPRWRAVAGLHNIIFPSKSTEIRRIEYVTVHRYYSERSMDNDIALLKLAAFLPYGDHIQPICIPYNIQLNMTSSTQCFVTGWGTTSQGGALAILLQEAQVNIIPSSLCNTPEWYNDIVSSNMICAGYEGGGIDACQGDSGGPFVCYIPEYRRFYQFGITSFGYGCGKWHFPGVYTRVENYKNWIQNNLLHRQLDTDDQIVENSEYQGNDLNKTPTRRTFNINDCLVYFVVYYYFFYL
ncbi:transmembrane protease serine 12-like [Ambystoma mexicanum]|uniref:transmembrane protease serine 12-like n=1 Tax=Ambystoma mexicanum TaxID=8296 RepID=UPI0037E7E550